MTLNPFKWFRAPEPTVVEPPAGPTVEDEIEEERRLQADLAEKERAERLERIADAKRQVEEQLLHEEIARLKRQAREDRMIELRSMLANLKRS